MTVPNIPDYKATQTEIPMVDIDSDTAYQTIDVYYVPIQYSLTINYVDADGKTVSSQKYSGAKVSTITPQYDLPDGYQLASVLPTNV
ncbi:hypothetical protein MOO47_00325 [Bombilactobacillus thymidiniphilus]|uniref:MucBP domain-containing protein n=1 Tax=Bombilactobacillus thymidiniphilus TaxID=2923363 RepID=A0ABY4PD31_9LACO|nr:hypothetical protein [Bombilactobacillus thymidiniphilus]UQS83683.1 hypothetical protein MOO47_00325 [Bombilactobacillus thymidiniphilus]